MNKSFPKVSKRNNINSNGDKFKKVYNNGTIENISKQKNKIHNKPQPNKLDNHETLQRRRARSEANDLQVNKKSNSNTKPKENRLNERKIINGEYAGKKYPSEKLRPDLQKKYPRSVNFDKNGYPDFSPYAKKRVEVKELNGNYANDFTLANKQAGFDRTPDGYTWHHHQDGKTMLLVPKDLHGAIRHTGGASKLRKSS